MDERLRQILKSTEMKKIVEIAKQNGKIDKRQVLTVYASPHQAMRVIDYLILNKVLRIKDVGVYEYCFDDQNNFVVEENKQSD